MICINTYHHTTEQVSSRYNHCLGVVIMFLQSFIHWLSHTLNALSDDDQQVDAGQGLVEYALILVFISVVAIVVAALLGPGIGNMYSNIISSIDFATN